ncbi:tRNA preQ1(34) S-adenosylmethionine ribosyltransferase-isomerase QueA [Kordiimonas pumila]|uniref:S-adenosylmethionine:tRNA ribosyltransferase-isomerase n=1 Tax=Kordiimonas pumila TaxID=2161677 RepID=A0ABV7D1J7_9PROT|nr:tRNA preQ1(34) S-adenosylmethionine ribosyltransferase-isomerase QueA [Kordiimonas pumila]
MKVDLFDFDLPKDRIALRPISPRDQARMMLVDNDIQHTLVKSLPDILLPNDILVFNNTKVIPGRLFGKRGNAKVEVTLHKRIDEVNWLVFARPAKKCRLGDVLNFNGLEAEVTAIGDEGERRIHFNIEPCKIWGALSQHGTMPLPPYIASQRDIDEQDSIDYQTIYAAEEGAVAAPTAGLHFTTQLLNALNDKGIHTAEVTLHVGAGTFLPVKVDDTANHKMHSEIGEISVETANKLNAVKKNGGRIVSVGTTSLRLLESAVTPDGTIHPFKGETDIFITPGYTFKAVDILMTNFHLPKSTLFMLVSAFAGMEKMKTAYKVAIDKQYRFYSYGDSSLLFRKTNNDQ